MAKPHSIDFLIKETEYLLAKYQFVKQNYSDVLCSSDGVFSSKLINSNYSKWYFRPTWTGLFVVPYCELNFIWNGKDEIITIHSQPVMSRLVYLKRWTQPKIIKFSRLAINLKNNKFKEEMLSSCQAEIMKFIKDNPGYKLDDKHLDPRLKKLLIFT